MKIKKLINQKYFFPIIYIIVVLGAIVLFAVNFGFYPIAVVNYTHPIMAYQFNKSLDLSLKYYGIKNDPNAIKVFKKVVFDSLIDEVAIDAELNKDMGFAEMDKQLNSQVNQILSDQKVQDALSAKGISLNDAKKYFLETAIKDQMLISQLQSKGENFNQWIVDQRKGLKVFVLMRGAHWTGSEIQFD